MHAEQSLQDYSVGIMLQDQSIKTILNEGDQVGHMKLQCSSPKRALIPIVIITKIKNTIVNTIMVNNVSTHTNRIKLTIYRTGTYLDCIVEGHDTGEAFSKKRIEYDPKLLEKGYKKKSRYMGVFTGLAVLFLVVTVTVVFFIRRPLVLQSLQQFLNLILP